MLGVSEIFSSAARRGKLAHPSKSPIMSVRNKYLIAALVALVWGGAMLAAFWWFEARYLRPFENERAELFSGDQLALPE